MSTGYFVNIGELSHSYIPEFYARADDLMRSENLQGSLAKLFTAEPKPGEWGFDSQNLSKNILSAISSTIVPQSSFVFTRSGLKPDDSEGYPEIVKAMENKKVKFLVGTAPDRRRIVAILLLK